MNKITIPLLILIVYSTQLFSQQIDSALFRKTAISYLKYYLEVGHEKVQRKYLYSVSWEAPPVTLSDSNNIKLYLPVLLLKEIPNNNWNYSALSPYINKDFSPYNQDVIIENNLGIFNLAIDRIQLRGDMQTAAEKASKTQPGPDSFPVFLSRTGPCSWDIVPTGTTYLDIRVPYKQVLQYADSNPGVTLFLIDDLPGIWGFRNNLLIKLEFKYYEVKELDGEEYYRDILFPLSPLGIEEVLGGSSFFIINTG